MHAGCLLVCERHGIGIDEQPPGLQLVRAAVAQYAARSRGGAVVVLSIAGGSKPLHASKTPRHCIPPPPPPPPPKVSEAAIKLAQKAEREAEKMKGLMRSRFDFLDDA